MTRPPVSIRHPLLLPSSTAPGDSLSGGPSFGGRGPSAEAQVFSMVQEVAE